MKIAENLQYLIGNEGVSNDAFGRIFNLNRGAIGAYLANKAKPKIETLQKISDYYKISIDNLVNVEIASLNKVHLNNMSSVTLDDFKIESFTKQISKKQEQFLENREFMLLITSLVKEQNYRKLAEKVEELEAEIKIMRTTKK